jgi:alcohol dehydrogenase, propanol-preferring
VTVSRCLRLHHPAPASTRPLQLEDRPIPEPGPGELLLAVGACAVCRTDLQLCEGDLALHQRPVVPGHQVAGRVVARGDGTAGWAVGDRAGVAWIAGTCGRCRFCTSGRENLCEAARFTGWDRDGGYADHVVVDATFAHRLPAGLDDHAAAPLLCGGAIGYRSLRVAGVEPGCRLGLYGFGASALCAIQVAAHWGCEIHVATRSPREQQRALALGASSVGSYDEPPPAPLDRAITFAPVGAVVVAALTALDRGGTVAVNAIHLDRIPEFPYDLLWWERSIRSVANLTRTDVAEFLALAAAIPVRTSTHTFDLTDANDALAALARGEVDGAAVLTTG